MDSYFFVDWNLWIFLINRVSGPLLIKTLGKNAEEARQIVEESVTLAHKAVEKKHAILAGSVGKFDGRFFDEIKNKKIEILIEIFPKKIIEKHQKLDPDRSTSHVKLRFHTQSWLRITKKGWKFSRVTLESNYWPSRICKVPRK